MSVAYYIVLKSEIAGFDPFVNGKAVAHANDKTLATICASLKVKPIAEFVSQDPGELAELIEDAGVDVPDELPEEQWFKAEEGLATVRAIIKHLSENPKALKNSTAVVEELQEYELVLERLQKEGVLWHFAVDF